MPTEPTYPLRLSHPDVEGTTVAATRSSHRVLAALGWVPAAETTDASGGLFNPSSHSGDDVNAHLEGASPEERDRVLAAEAAGRARKGVLEGPHTA